MADGGRSAEEREAARLERERRRAEQALEDGAFDDGAFDGDGHEEDHEEDHEEEVPIGIRRVARRERVARAAQTPRPRRPAGARRRPVRARRPAAARGERRFGLRRSVLAGVVALVVVVPVAVVLWFANGLLQPFSGQPHGRVVVTVPPHSGAQQVGNLLARDGVVPSGFFFDMRALLAGDRGKLRAGTYTLKLDMSYSQVLKILITAPPAAKVSELTIVEGKTRRQIDALLRSQNIASGYLAATAHSPLLDPGKYGAPRGDRLARGLPVPLHLPAARPDPALGPDRRSAEDVQAALRRGQPGLRRTPPDEPV